MGMAIRRSPLLGIGANRPLEGANLRGRASISQPHCEAGLLGEGKFLGDAGVGTAMDAD